jgi:signal recognition particle subunit SRP54
MFDELGSKLDEALKKLRQRGVLNESMIKEGLREVRRVLLEADVNFQVTRDFLGRVQERALGEAVLKAVSPGQQIVKIVHDELGEPVRRGAGDARARRETAGGGPHGRVAGVG